MAERSPSSQAVAVLHLEDSDLDADLVRQRLERAGLEVSVDRAVDRKDFAQRLRGGRYDLILSDYQVPSFEGLAALDMATEHQPETPFLFVSGTMGEELAVETLKRGATDYVLKDRLARLPAAAARAIEESRGRAERRRAQEDLRRSEEFNRSIVESSRDCIMILDVAGHLLSTTEAAPRLLRIGDLAPRHGKSWVALWPEPERPAAESAIRDAAAGRSGTFVAPLPTSAGDAKWWDVVVSPILSPGGEVEQLLASLRDVTDRRQAAEELERLLAESERHAAMLQRLAAASLSINAVLSAESIARTLSEEARSILQANAAVTTLKPAGDDFRGLRAACCTKDDAANSRVADTGWEITDRVFREVRPIHVCGGASGPNSPPILAVPLIDHGGGALGVVQLAGKADGDFTVKDEAVLVQLAAIAAGGIQNARLYERVREQDRRKDEFLATLAHELRNPLAPIRTGLTVLQLTDSADQAAEARGMMERQIGHMVRLIDDLLDVSRITRGKIELRRQPVDVREVLAAALEVSRPLIEASGHSLSVAAADASLPLDADPTRIAQVVSNLLNNAAKYTPPGGRIELCSSREGDQAVISVRDDGVGIDTAELPKVFEMFTQVGKRVDCPQGGLGIGLALVARLVELHGGSVHADSPGIGCGSLFSIRLPLADTPHPQPDAPRQTAAS